MTSTTITLNILVLFKGTGSVEKSLRKYEEENKNIKFNIRGLDILKKFKPYYCSDILKFNYKKEFKTFRPDFIWASPLCSQFTQLKTLSNHTRDLSLGFSLLDKTLEIIEYTKTINPNLLFCIENPKNKILNEYKPLKKFIQHITSYCKYDFSYRKDTFFWSNFNIDFIKPCRKRCCCDFVEKNGYHRVVLCYAKPDKYKLQIKDTSYMKELRLKGEVIRNIQELRYRIPVKLIKQIIKDMIKKYKDNEEKVNLNICRECIEDITNQLNRFSLDCIQEKEIEREEDLLDYIDYPEEEEGERYNCDICSIE